MNPIDPRRSERHLLAAVHRWARTSGWWYGFYGWVEPEGAYALDIRAASGEVAVWRMGPAGLVERYIRAESVVQAIDLLVVYGYLPPMWSSAYGLAEDRYREQVETLTEELGRAQGAYRDVVAGWAERADMFTVGARVEIGAPR